MLVWLWRTKGANSVEAVGRAWTLHKTRLSACLVCHGWGVAMHDEPASLLANDHGYQMWQQPTCAAQSIHSSLCITVIWI